MRNRGFYSITQYVRNQITSYKGVESDKETTSVNPLKVKVTLLKVQRFNPSTLLLS
jgi:hypothetical protein